MQSPVQVGLASVTVPSPWFREHPYCWQLLWPAHLERRPHCGAGVDPSNSCSRLYRTTVQGSAAREEMQETAAQGFPRLQAYFAKSLIASGQSSREAGQVRSPTS